MQIEAKKESKHGCKHPEPEKIHDSDDETVTRHATHEQDSKDSKHENENNNTKVNTSQNDNCNESKESKENNNNNNDNNDNNNNDNKNDNGNGDSDLDWTDSDSDILLLPSPSPPPPPRPMTKQLYRYCYNLLNDIICSEDSLHFCEPIDWKGWELNDYLELKQYFPGASDLYTVRKRLENGVYNELAAFALDLKNVFRMAMRYHSRGQTQKYKINIKATILLNEFEEQHQKILSMQDNELLENRDHFLPG